MKSLFSFIRTNSGESRDNNKQTTQNGNANSNNNIHQKNGAKSPLPGPFTRGIYGTFTCSRPPYPTPHALRYLPAKYQRAREKAHLSHQTNSNITRKSTVTAKCNKRRDAQPTNRFPGKRESWFALPCADLFTIYRLNIVAAKGEFAVGAFLKF